MLLHKAKWSARFIQPLKPCQNGFMESIHATLRRDHIVVEVFFSGLDAHLNTGIHRNDANQLRPNAALGYKASAEVATVKIGSLMVSLGYQMRARPKGQMTCSSVRPQWAALRLYGR